MQANPGAIGHRRGRRGVGRCGHDRGQPVRPPSARGRLHRRAGPWENRSDLLRGVEWWQERGYRVKLADGVGASDNYVAGDPNGRARDLEAMFADPEVDVVQDRKSVV